MKFRPLHDRVVVKRIDAEEKTAGGIIIPDTAKEKPSQGEITAVGPGGRDESGKLIPINGTTNAGALWVPQTSQGSGNVPARIYDSAGAVVNDLTGNWWTSTFSGASSTRVVCARGWYKL